MNELYFIHVIDREHPLCAAIAAAEEWLRNGGYDPARFTWECRKAQGVRFLYASCIEEAVIL